MEKEKREAVIYSLNNNETIELTGVVYVSSTQGRRLAATPIIHSYVFEILEYLTSIGGSNTLWMKLKAKCISKTAEQ